MAVSGGRCLLTIRASGTRTTAARLGITNWWTAPSRWNQGRPEGDIVGHIVTKMPGFEPWAWEWLPTFEEIHVTDRDRRLIAESWRVQRRDPNELKNDLCFLDRLHLSTNLPPIVVHHIPWGGESARRLEAVGITE